MTPKEKACEILLEVRNLTDGIDSYNYDSVNIDISNYIVSEIIKTRPSLPIEPFGGSINLGECVNLSIKYWNDVKAEIKDNIKK